MPRSAHVFPWLPMGYDLGGWQVGPVSSHGEHHQVVRTACGSAEIILVHAGSRAAELLSDREAVHIVTFAEQDIAACIVDGETGCCPVGDLPARVDAISGGELSELVEGLVRLQEDDAEANWADSLFVPDLALCLPMATGAVGEDRRLLAVEIMTGGVRDRRLSAIQIRRFNPWLTLDEIEGFLRLADGAPSDGGAGTGGSRTGSLDAFLLPGQSELGAFLDEHVVEHERQRERYEALGVHAPNGILLHGPPGSGKSHAVRKLAEHLRWPVIDIHLGNIGSPYIHQTSVKLHEAFEQAARTSPSILVLEEVDVLASHRSGHSHGHQVEETTQLLRLMEEAAARGVLVIATTNRKDEIDPAFLRRGRFDLTYEVGFPSESDIRSALEALVTQRPHVAGLNLDAAAQRLAGRPISDVAWVVNEAARLAVRQGKSQIDDLCIFAAVGRVRR